MMRNGCVWLAVAWSLAASHAATTLREPINTATLDSPAKQVAWVGTIRAGTVAIVITKAGSVFRSTNGGDEWTKIGLGSAVASSETHPEVAFIEGTYAGEHHDQTSLVTVDGGQKFETLTTPFSITGVKYHPRMAKWAIGHTGRHCTLRPCMGKSGGLVMTKDGGLTWKRIAESVEFPHYAWADPPQWAEKPLVKDDEYTPSEAVDKAKQGAILIVQWRMQGGQDSRQEAQRTLVRSTDFFTSQQDVLDDVQEFRVLQGKTFASRHGTLWLSDLAKQSSFTEARLPAVLPPGAVQNILVAGNHFLIGVPTAASGSVEGQPIGRLFRSDNSGRTWTLALEDCYHIAVNGPGQLQVTEAKLAAQAGQRYWRPDLHIVAGVEGMMLVNKAHPNEQKHDSHRNKSSVPVRTVVTYDSGIHWHPVVDTACGPTCFLHLTLADFSRGDDRPHGARSMVSYPGSVTASGQQVGTASSAGKDWGLYHSRDGGVSWARLGDGRQNFATSDHGAIVMRVKADVSVTEAYFSSTEGWEKKTWQKVTFPPIIVIQMVQAHSAYDPKSRYAEAVTPMTRILLLGHNPRTGAGVLMTVDVAASKNSTSWHQCKSPDKEKWAVGGPGCILGRRTTCERRKLQQGCYIGGVRGLQCQRKHCACTDTDYECDYGFRMSAPSGDVSAGQSLDLFGGKVCSVDPTFYKSKSDKRFAVELQRLYNGDAKLSEVCKRLGSSQLEVPSGYRKIPGDSCTHMDTVAYQKCVHSGKAPHKCGEAGYETCLKAGESVAQCVSLHGIHGAVTMHCKGDASEDNTAKKRSKPAEVLTTRFSDSVAQVFPLGEGKDRSYVALINQRGGVLYRSTDHGASWQQVGLRCEAQRDFTRKSSIKTDVDMPQDSKKKTNRKYSDPGGPGHKHRRRKHQTWSIGGHAHNMEPPESTTLQLLEEHEVVADQTLGYENDQLASAVQKHGGKSNAEPELTESLNHDLTQHSERSRDVSSMGLTEGKGTGNGHGAVSGAGTAWGDYQAQKAAGAVIKSARAKEKKVHDKKKVASNEAEIEKLQHDTSTALKTASKMNQKTEKLKVRQAEHTAVVTEGIHDETAKLVYDEKVANDVAKSNYQRAVKDQAAIVKNDEKRMDKTKALKLKEPPASPTPKPKIETLDPPRIQLKLDRDEAIIQAAKKKKHANDYEKPHVLASLNNKTVQHDLRKIASHAVSKITESATLNHDLSKNWNHEHGKGFQNTVKHVVEAEENGEKVNKDISKTVNDLVKSTFGKEKPRTSFFKEPQPLHCGTHSTQINEIVISPADSRVAFIVGGGRLHWITENAGESFTSIYTDYRIGGVRFHKSQPRHLLAVTEDSEEILLYSRNLGETWVPVGKRIRRPFYDWVPVPGQQGERICAVQFGEESATDTLWSDKTHLACAKTDNPMPTLQPFDDPMALKAGNRFDLVGHHIIVAAALSGGSDADLLVGNRIHILGDNNAKGTVGFQYRHVKLASGALKNGYELIRMQGQRHHVFILAGSGHHGGTLYRVNLRLATSVVSLAGVYRKSHGMEGPSIVPVAGVEGHYLANHISKREAVSGAFFSRTMVTVDNGAHWMAVEPPHDSASGVPYACPHQHEHSKSKSKNCKVVAGAKLHLKLGLSGVLASKKSHGIVIANGNVLTKYPKDPIGTYRTETFLSRDGGISWEVVLSGECEGSASKECRQRFAFGDHGSILAAAPGKGKVNRLRFTLDEGVAWNSVQLPQLSVLAEVASIAISVLATDLKCI